VLEDDAEEAEDRWGHHISPLELLGHSEENQAIMMCLTLNKNIFNAMKIFNHLDILKLWKYYTYIKAFNYRQLPKAKNEL
jgi:hypothetical protein